MKASLAWNHAPFTRLHETHKKDLPYICALSPFDGGFSFEWFDCGSNGSHKAVVHKHQSYDAPIEYELDSRTLEISGLEREVTYELTVYRSDMSARSETRLVRTGHTLGKVINYLHPLDNAYSHSGNYLGTPIVVKLPSGKLIVSMDVFGNSNDCHNLTILFESTDGGESWNYVTELSPCLWGRLFVHNGKLYCIALSAHYGDLLIGCSEDEGRTWSEPVCLIRGTYHSYGCHQNGGPVIVHDGKIYATFEYGNWKYRHFLHSLLWADVDADLLDPHSWSFTEPADVDKNAEGMPLSVYLTAMEGNPVVLPDSTVGVLLRLDPMSMPMPDANKAMLVRMDANNPEGKLMLDRVVNMPCGLRNKFMVKFDPTTGKYLALGNEYVDGYMQGRAILTLSASDDCINWRVLSRIADARPDIELTKNNMSYSYPSFEFDGDDLLVVLRVASNGAKNAHDTNTITFIRIEDYKKYL